jgi:quercetin dioxygenase-like cupin family protein
LAALDSELRKEEAYARNGHAARTLVREPDLRLVLVVLKAGGRMAEHRVDQTFSLHALRGHVRLHLPDGMADLAAGRLLVLGRDLAHDVEAIEESALLLTIGWRG